MKNKIKKYLAIAIVSSPFIAIFVLLAIDSIAQHQFLRFLLVIFSAFGVGIVLALAMEYLMNPKNEN